MHASPVSPMVVSGTDHSLGLSSDGTVYGWGSNASGQIGFGRKLQATSPQAVSGLNLGQNSGLHWVSSGNAHELIVKSDGSVWARGDNSSDQLGDGTNVNHSSLVQVQGLSSVVAVAAGYDHSLSVKSDGSVWAWGGDYSIDAHASMLDLTPVTPPVTLDPLATL